MADSILIRKIIAFPISEVLFWLWAGTRCMFFLDLRVKVLEFRDQVKYNSTTGWRAD